MAWLADAHSEWHAVHGRNVVCPLDCGIGEAEALEADWEAEQEPEEHHHIICGNCRDLHETVDEVKACYAQ